MATTKLLDLGHRAIAYLGSKDLNPSALGEDPAMKERLEGYRLAFKAKGLNHDPKAEFPISRLNREGIIKGIEKMLTGGKKITAAVTYDEGFAEILIEYLKSMKTKVPDDVSVVAAGACSKSSTISRSYFDPTRIADEAWNILRQRNDPGKTVSSKPMLKSIAPEYMEGTTTAPPSD